MYHHSTHVDYQELLSRCQSLIQQIQHEDEVRFVNHVDFRGIVHLTHLIEAPLHLFLEGKQHQSQHQSQDQSQDHNQHQSQSQHRDRDLDRNSDRDQDLNSVSGQQKDRHCVQELEGRGKGEDTPIHRIAVENVRDVLLETKRFIDKYACRNVFGEASHMLNEAYVRELAQVQGKLGESVKSLRFLAGMHDTVDLFYVPSIHGNKPQSAHGALHRETSGHLEKIHTSDASGSLTNQSFHTDAPKTARQSSIRGLAQHHDDSKDSIDNYPTARRNSGHPESHVLQNITDHMMSSSKFNVSDDNHSAEHADAKHSGHYAHHDLPAKQHDTVEIGAVLQGAVAHGLIGHCGEVTCIVGLSDGSLVSGSKDGTVKCWDMAHTPYPYTNGCLHTFVIPSASAQSHFDLHPAGLPGRLHHASVETIGVTCLAVSCQEDSASHAQSATVSLSDRSTIVAGYSDGSIRVWDARHRFRDSGSQDESSKSHGSTTSRSVASSYSVKTTRAVDDTTSKSCVCTLREHEADVTCMAMLPDRVLVTGSMDGTLKLWSQTQSCNEGHCISPEHTRSDHTLVNNGHAIRCLAVVSVGYVVFGTDEGTLAVFSPHFRSVLHRWEAHHDSITALVTFKDDLVVSASWDATMKLWDIGNGIDVKCINTMHHVSCVSRGQAGSKADDSEEVVVNHVSTIAEYCPLAKVRDVTGPSESPDSEPYQSHVSDDSNYIVANFGLHSVKVWEPEACNCKQTVWLAGDILCEGAVSATCGLATGKLAVGLTNGNIFVMK